MDEIMEELEDQSSQIVDKVSLISKELEKNVELIIQKPTPVIELTSKELQENMELIIYKENVELNIHKPTPVGESPQIVDKVSQTSKELKGNVELIIHKPTPVGESPQIVDKVSQTSKELKGNVELTILEPTPAEKSSQFLDNVSVISKESITEEPIPVKKSSKFLEEILHINTFDDFIDCSNKPFTFIPLSKYSDDYEKVEKKFKESLCTESIVIEKIVKVLNPFLYAQYSLKKCQKGHESVVKEHELFHGTKQNNIDSICNYNFNWRFFGNNGFLGGKFGNGVSFSPFASYARDYPRKCAESPRVMFLAKVLESNRCIGHLGQTIPVEMYDTTTSANGEVVVKYYDNEFYPEYIIYYKS